MLNRPEDDDELHLPDPKRDVLNDSGSIFTLRALVNLGCMAILVFGIIALFAGYPVVMYFTKTNFLGVGFNAGVVPALYNSSTIPTMPGLRGLIDPDTPQSAKTKQSYVDGTQLQLVFSDEFNTDGRSFYPGDDPYWEAVNLHYWQTGNLEWYDPEAITTRNGSLKITLSAKQNHNLNYTGGMLSSWNSFCFTGGLIEAAVTLPGANNIQGLWPAVWTMGNLGRAGYGASLDGTWPYSYDACDVGTVANQSINGLPNFTPYPGDPYHNNLFSFLPGQRLSRCTCPGESHPGPLHSDNTFVGRSAPEIDVFEALVHTRPPRGAVSQSSQWAPFDAGWEWLNTSANMVIQNPQLSNFNTYTGGSYQEATSVVTTTNQQCYELAGGCSSTYGFEYKPGYAADNASITWVSDGQPAWTFNAAGVGADPRVNISARPISQEPMYIIANLGISTSFGYVDLNNLQFPTTMSIDYIRVYQHPDNINYGCDPANFPTEAYINKYIQSYTNPLLTTWTGDYNQVMPKNSLLGQC